jgi:phage terminase large subunit-like protein
VTLDLAFGRLAEHFAPAQPDDTEQDLDGYDPLGWRIDARDEQLPPAGAWDVWYVRGGRGAGKTWTCANTFAEMIAETVEAGRAGEWAVVAPTMGDVRTTCFESQDSGLIRALGGRVAPGGELLETGPYISRWNRSTCELYLRDGTVIYGDGADDGALRLQGKNLRGVWADEVGLWKRWQTAWDESIGFAVRKAPARIIASGTPKRGMPALVLVKRLLSRAADEPGGTVRTTLLRTVDNIANLAGAALERMRWLQGTALGRQELEGEILDEAEGALWTRDPDKADREQLGLIVNDPGVRQELLGRTVVALDPSDGSEGGDAVGFVVAASHLDGRPRVLHSGENHLGPAAQVREARRLFDLHQADRVVIEKNYGQAYLVELFRTLDPTLPVKVVDATQGKRTRAEPVAALYTRPGVVHVGDGHELLEDQQTSFTGAPGEQSPNALDALVWALTELAGGGTTAVFDDEPLDDRDEPDFFTMDL